MSRSSIMWIAIATGSLPWLLRPILLTTPGGAAPIFAIGAIIAATAIFFSEERVQRLSAGLVAILAIVGFVAEMVSGDAYDLREGAAIERAKAASSGG